MTTKILGHFHELRCKCGRLIGFIKQSYYIKHEYLCIECYMNKVRENARFE